MTGMDNYTWRNRGNLRNTQNSRFIDRESKQVNVNKIWEVIYKLIDVLIP
jgi:hypothetical protein